MIVKGGRNGFRLGHHHKAGRSSGARPDTAPIKDHLFGGVEARRLVGGGAAQSSAPRRQLAGRSCRAERTKARAYWPARHRVGRSPGPCRLFLAPAARWAASVLRPHQARMLHCTARDAEPFSELCFGQVIIRHAHTRCWRRAISCQRRLRVGCPNCRPTSPPAVCLRTTANAPVRRTSAGGRTGAGRSDMLPPVVAAATSLLWPSLTSGTQSRLAEFLRVPSIVKAHAVVVRIAPCCS